MPVHVLHPRHGRVSNETVAAIKEIIGVVLITNSFVSGIVKIRL